MRGWRFGVSILALVATIGCGKTDGHGPSDLGAGGDGDGAGATNGVAGSQQVAAGTSSGGSEPAGGSSGVSGDGTGAGNGLGGRGTLPPDGAVAPPVALHKLDLLLMLDNSRNTAEKQRILKDAVQWLLTPGAGPALAADDIHVGVVTSSLGSHGAPGAKDVCVVPSDDDHARLLGSIRPGLVTFNNSGFLAWGPGAEAKLETVVGQLGPMIDAAGDQGCGYESSLEAWYRFLIDPSPPAAIALNGTLAFAQGTDTGLLAQRKAFLRSDSVLSIVMLTDENDCSIVDRGYGWLIARASSMYRSTSACANPNDKCCQSCAEQAANAGCPALDTDPECTKGQTLAPQDDDLNLRCFDQKRRFGFTLLQPVERYIEGLTRQHIFDDDGTVVPNPLFAGAPEPRRHPSQVILTGIVGVPWQDVADKASLSGAGLTLLSAAELTKQGRWDMMLGDPEASPPKRPTDPFMIETPDDRSALNSVHASPVVPTATLVPSSSTNPQANVINGHEAMNVGNRDLQAACIFPLATPMVCDVAALNADRSCRCFPDDAVFNYAMCQPPGGGAAGTTQYFEQAYPGLRHLQVLKGLGDSAITASICPKVVTPDALDYGYRPAMKALAARIQVVANP
jgi:hypothetical protein